MRFLGRWLHNRSVGKRGEDIVALSLRDRGLKIIARNWQENKSEIDIIAISKKRKTIHIIEVKSRTSNDWEAVSASLTSQKVGALKRGAYEFIAVNPKYKGYALQFDVAVVFFSGDNHSIEYIENIRF